MTAVALRDNAIEVTALHNNIINENPHCTHRTERIVVLDEQIPYPVPHGRALLTVAYG